LLNSISSCFRDIGLKRIGITTLTFAGLLDIIGHVTIRLAIGHFLLALLWNQALISNGSRDNYSMENVTQWLM